MTGMAGMAGMDAVEATGGRPGNRSRSGSSRDEPVRRVESR